MPGIACNKGFTLIELLLAMAISAFVAVVGYQGLSVAITASKVVAEETSQLADIQLALAILEQDISQIIARPIRNELSSIEAIMSGGLSNEALLRFTREGWQNPGNLRRTELARINYQWVGRSLIRQRWLVLDRVSLDEGLEQAVLLEGIEDIQVEFFSPFISNGVNVMETNSGVGQWTEWWSSERLGLDYQEPLPAAVRITLSINGFGQISRIITINAA